jgi:hypothetical protein
MDRLKSDSANPPAGSEDPSDPTSYLGRLMAEPRILVTNLAKEIGVDPATATRWVLVGIKERAANGVRPVIKLESYRIGGRLYTSRAAFERFVSAQNAHVTAPTVASASRTDKSRRAASESAATKAAALGY